MAKKTKNKSEIRKNTILFLVEGESDKRALEIPISELFDVIDPHYKVVFSLQKHHAEKVEDTDDESVVIDDDEDPSEDVYDDLEEDVDDEDDIYGGDITTAYGVWPKNIEYEISKRFFVPIIKKEGLYAKRLLKVIQIVDLDGAYLPEDSLVPYAPERAENDKFYYNTDRNVIEGNIEKISKRNHHKRQNIDALVRKNVIHIQNHEVSYSVYYFSSNLDHALHNDANMTYGKITEADAFAEQFYDDVQGFLTFFDQFDSGELRGLDYYETWELVRDRTSTRSIQPGTNLHLLFREILEKRFPLPR